MARVKRASLRALVTKDSQEGEGLLQRRRKVFRAAKQAVIKAGQYAYRGRKIKKRDFRGLWITRINAAARLHEMSYSKLIAGLKAAGLTIDRKVLADLAMNDPTAFGVIAERAKSSLQKAA